MNPLPQPQKAMLMQDIRTRVYTLIRSFCTTHGFREVHTPCLSPRIIPESAITVFGTELETWQRKIPLYLLPSPEYYMKQLLSNDSGSIFQIAHAFRNAETRTGQHSLEFALLEWYALEHDYLTNLELQEQFLEKLVEDSRLWSLIAQLGWHPHQIKALQRRLTPPIERISLQQAFERWAGIDLYAALTAGRFPGSPPKGAAERLADQFSRLLCDFIEPNLPTDHPVALIDYPAAVPTTAADNGIWAERWELYLGGYETANCYTEATPDHLSPIFDNELEMLEQQQRKQAADIAFPDRIANLPPCSGNALGIDRLLMALTGENRIDGVILFPIHVTLPS